MALPTNLLSTTVTELNTLIGLQEDAHLEFKRQLPDMTAGNRHEFLADMSAFANSGGGDIVFGMDEDAEGRASALAPLTGVADAELRRCLDILANGVEPQIPGLHAHSLAVPGGFVLIFRIRPSWLGPHRVKTNQHFFIREGSRKRQLDMPGIKGLFLQSDSQAQRVRDFRIARLGKLASGETPAKLVPGSLFIVHLIPTQAISGQVYIDPVPYGQSRALPTLGATAAYARLNVDGALGLRTYGKDGTHGYSLFFRNGFYETVKVLTPGEKGRCSLPSQSYEKEFIVFFSKYLEELSFQGVAEELTCMVSIVGANRVELGLNRFAYNIDESQGRFDRDVLAIPDVILQSGEDVARRLRPVFDLIWQSAGIAGSLNFDADGNWAPQVQ